MTDKRFWIGVVSREHVQSGIRGGFVQLSHGKKDPLQRLRAGDGFIYYSPRASYPTGDLCQMFTAIGIVKSGVIYQVDMGEDFHPFRIDVLYLNAHETPIRPLLDKLSFIKNKTNWGAAFRFGCLAVPVEDFKVISEAMGCHFALHFESE